MLLMFCFVLGRRSVLLIVFCFERGILAAHNFVCFGMGIYVDQRCLFWEGDSCCSSLFVLGGNSVSLIVFCFGKGIRVSYRFFCFGRVIRVAHYFFVLAGGSCC